MKRRVKEEYTWEPKGSKRRSTSDLIMEIRLAAGGSSEVCCTCGRPASDPYRAHGPDGKITEGCVDAIHTGRLVAISSSNAWHCRKESEEIRKGTLASLREKR